MGDMRRRFRHGLLVSAASICFAAAAPVAAQTRSFDLPAQDAKTGIPAFAKQASMQLLANAKDLRSKRTNAVRGNLDPQEALKALLRGTGLEVASDAGTGIFMVRQSSGEALAGSAAASDESAEVIVTGSRIKGAPVASPVVTLAQSDIRDTGKTTVGDALRTLPQNFSGGQNPGVAGGGDQGGTNQNFASASTINLRGLGSDATLTLINGHRVAYDSYSQGVDIDSIPLAALDKIEVVPDGASALYGSDAVGGVANILLKRDYDGLSLSARYGGATDGGDRETELSAVTGAKWSNGGVIATLDYARASAINAGDRSYTQSLSPDQTLLPGKSQYSGIISGHETVGSLDFSIDGLFNRRSTRMISSFAPPGNYLVSGSNDPFKEISYSISPRIGFAISPAWSSYITGTYGRDDSSVTTREYSNSSVYQSGDVHYDNSVRTIEAGVEGPLFSFLSQSIRLAAGVGYRSNALDVRSASTASLPAETFGRRSSYYAYGELAMPIVSPAMAIPAIYHLEATGALRYERYPGEASLATPKLGLIYSPVRSFEFKASWGKSFKTPTLYQEFQSNAAVVLPAYYLAPGLPAAANVILVSGGMRGLRPERATSWTLTGDFKPVSFAGFDLQVSYFHTRYKDRVIEPISTFSAIYTDPIYSNLVTFNPSAALQQEIIDTSAGGLRNLTGLAYDPSTVAALIDDRNRNADRQVIRGVDGSISYRQSIDASQSVTFSASGSYLKTTQQLGAGQPYTGLAGAIFKPPHWRGSGGIVWNSSSLTVGANITYIGAVKDIRFTPIETIHAIAPLDLTGSYTFGSASQLLRNVQVTLTVQNVLNQKPEQIRTTAPYDPTYDSANYSVVGRFVSFTITRKF